MSVLMFVFIGVLVESLVILGRDFSLRLWLKALALSVGGLGAFVILSMPADGFGHQTAQAWLQVGFLFAIGAFLVAFANIFPQFLFAKVNEQTLLVLTAIYWYLLLSFVQIPLSFGWWQAILLVSVVMTGIVAVSSLSKRDMGKPVGWLLSGWSVWVLLVIGLVMAVVAGWPESEGGVAGMLGLVSFGMVILRLFLKAYGILWFSLVPFLTEPTWKSKYLLIKQRVVEFSRQFVDRQDSPNYSWMYAALGVGVLVINRYQGWLPDLLLVNVYLLTMLHSGHRQS